MVVKVRKTSSGDVVVVVCTTRNIVLDVSVSCSVYNNNPSIDKLRYVSIYGSNWVVKDEQTCVRKLPSEPLGGIFSGICVGNTAIRTTSYWVISYFVKSKRVVCLLPVDDKAPTVDYNCGVSVGLTVLPPENAVISV